MGSLARPHGQDRRALRHAPSRTRSKSTKKDFNTERVKGKPHRRRTPSRSRRCGRCLTRLVQPKARQPDAACKSSSCTTARHCRASPEDKRRRTGSARRSTKGCRASGPALHSGQDFPNAIVAPPRRGLRQTRSWCCTKLDAGLPAPLLDYQPGAVAALPRAAGGGQGRVRGTS